MHDRIYLLYIYGKDGQSDLTREQAKMLGEVVKATAEDLKKGGK